MKLVDAQDEQRLIRGQKEYLDLEVRKYKRKKLLSYHALELELLREVSSAIQYKRAKSFSRFHL